VSFDLPVGRYQVIDSDPSTWAQNKESNGRGFFYLMGTPAKDAWPPLPDALVSLASVSNGCGGGTASTDPRWGDTSTYLDSNNPLGTRYTVNFREACNNHDAGYSGAKVRDAMSGKVIDFFTWTQKQVDDKFLAEMRTLCDQQIPATAPVALADCKARGGKTSLGAESRYNAVRLAGHKFWRQRPKLRGAWNNKSDPEAPGLTIVQTLRSVRATWRGDKDHPGLRGEFRGTLISRDQDSIIKGFAKVTYQGKTVTRPMHINADPDTPNVIEVGGPGIAGSMARS
jgi:hypothetical protein